MPKLQATGALFAIALLASPALSAPGYVTITNDYGGGSDLYTMRAEALARDGKAVHLAGICASACTMYLWRKFGLDVCAQPGTTLLFHKPGWYNPDPLGAHLPLTGPNYAAAADDLWKREDLAQLPANIARLLRKMHVPSVSEGDNPRQVVAIRALDVLPRCE